MSKGVNKTPSKPKIIIDNNNFYSNHINKIKI